LPDQQDLTKALNIDLKHIVFLRNYILLHQILGSGKFLSFREDFFSFLQQVHE